MLFFSGMKIVALAGAVVLLTGICGMSGAAARRLPPDVCVFHRHVVAAGTVCSYKCDPATKWCSQQSCINGQFARFLPCLQPFCTSGCG